MSIRNALIASGLVLGLAAAAHAGPPPVAKSAPSVSEHKRVGVEEASGRNLAEKSDDGDKGGGKKLAIAPDGAMGLASGQASGKINLAGKSDDGDKGGDKGGGKKDPAFDVITTSALAQDPSRGATPGPVQIQQQTSGDVAH